ncbi:MAG: UbiX family flavin prenyltransferase [Sphaerochaeta sp.]|jgi:polyprenyl P-hydroxybenzoate/phenylacrylic acid decarboxylase-like protein|uniref:UbiX family flavin prenyltransferase n=1 Tax=Sphaerochaeta sp. TaxID=1972642 RepID=UPI002FC768CD
MKRVLVAMTGASGSMYGMRLVQRLVTQQDVAVHLVLSDWAKEVMDSECTVHSKAWLADLQQRGVTVHAHNDLAASPSSGSFRLHAMVIIPCSMGTLGAIAAGLASNLIERAASVCLKERRRLILVARESPLSSIHLQQMLTLSNAGAMIMPPVPAFYTHPSTIEDIVDTTIDRILDAIDLDDGNAKRWRDT